MDSEADIKSMQAKWVELCERAKAEGFSDEIGSYEVNAERQVEISARAMFAFDLVGITIGYQRALEGLLAQYNKREFTIEVQAKAAEQAKRLIENEKYRAVQELMSRQQDRKDAEGQIEHAVRYTRIAFKELVDAIGKKRLRLVRLKGDAEEIGRLEQLQKEFMEQATIYPVLQQINQ